MMINRSAKTFPPAARAWTRDVGPTAQQPAGIIKCMPVDFISVYGVRTFLDHFYYRMNRFPDAYFLFTLPSIPKQDVLHFYLLIGGRIRFRANIVQFEGPSTRHFADGRSVHGNAWVFLGAPVVRPPFKIEMRGFRGYRYTEELW